MSYKRILSSFLIVNFVFLPSSYCFADEVTDHELLKFENEVQQTNVEVKSNQAIKARINYDEAEEHPGVFTGDVEAIQEGAKLNMTVASVISSGLNQEGDEFFAEVTDDFSSETGILIPAGTVAHGKVTKVANKKRLGRDGYINIEFDYLITPDNRKIPIEAAMTTKRHPVASTAKVILEDTAYTVAGGIIGGLISLKFLGLSTAVATKGASVAGGAGVGGLLGLTASLFRKGKETLIAPGDEIKVKVAENIELPVMSEEFLKDKEVHFDGLNVKITSYMIHEDPFGEPNTITIAVDIVNKTEKTFSSFDMALQNDYERTYYASPFGNTDLWFQKIYPNSSIKGSMSFSVDNPKKRHWLVFYDSRTRKPLAKFSLKNAERSLKRVSKK